MARAFELDAIPVVAGAGVGATSLDAFDAALADVALGDYNLVELSSILPPGTTASVVPELDADWEVGTPVAVVMGVATGERTRAAGLGWTIAEEGGVFYEESAPAEDACERRLRRGLERARERRDWTWTSGIETVTASHGAPADGVGGAVAAAVYGPLPGVGDGASTIVPGDEPD